MDKQDSLLARDPLSLVMFAAWCNLPADKLPAEMRAHTCPATAEAWGRVAAAVRSFMGSDEVVERAGNALQQGWSFADDAGLHALPDIEFSPHEREHLARAALSAAIGEPTSAG